jgi:ribosome-associated protein
MIHMTKNENLGERLVEVVVSGMQEKKANRISVLDLKGLEHAVTDYFVICNAESSTQVSAIADSVEHFTFKELKEKAIHKEGTQNAFWILLDYGNVVVHIFQDEAREFYDIESFWADAIRKDYAENEV